MTGEHEGGSGHIDSVITDIADWATIVALAIALGVFFTDLYWRRRLRAKELLRDLTGPGSEAMIREVRSARDLLGIDAVAVTTWTAAERRRRWTEVLDEIEGIKVAGDPTGDTRVIAVNTLIVFHNRMEEIADGYLSWFASRRLLREALDRFLVSFSSTYEGFYGWYIDRDAKRVPPKDHGYLRIRRMVARVAVTTVENSRSRAER